MQNFHLGRYIVGYLLYRRKFSFRATRDLKLDDCYWFVVVFICVCFCFVSLCFVCLNLGLLLQTTFVSSEAAGESKHALQIV